MSENFLSGFGKKKKKTLRSDLNKVSYKWDKEISTDKHSSKKSQDSTKTTQDFILNAWYKAFLELFVKAKN